MRAGLLLLCLAACGEPAAPAVCAGLGEPEVTLGAGNWHRGWHDLEAGDPIELQPGRTGKRPYEVSLRVRGVDTGLHPDGLGAVEILVHGAHGQVGGYFGRPRFRPLSGSGAETLGLAVVADVENRWVDGEDLDFSASVADACGRRADAVLGLYSVVHVPSY